MSLLSLTLVAGLTATATVTGAALLVETPSTHQAPAARVVARAPNSGDLAMAPPPSGPAVPGTPRVAPSREGAWPLQPRPQVRRGFDPPGSPWGAGHRGVDLAGKVGAAVHATKAGTVVFAGRLAGRGVVVVSHGLTRTTYEPVDASVRVGDHVEKSSVLGVLRRGGSHCFPAVCLHWGLLRGDTYLNPLTLVGGGPVRLLPLSGVVAAP